MLTDGAKGNTSSSAITGVAELRTEAAAVAVRHACGPNRENAKRVGQFKHCKSGTWLGPQTPLPVQFPGGTEVEVNRGISGPLHQKQPFGPGFKWVTMGLPKCSKVGFDIFGGVDL